MDQRKKGLFYAFITVFLWATLAAGLKLAVSRLDSFVVTVCIGFFATLALLVWSVIRKKTTKLITEFKKYPWFFILTGVIGLGIQQVLYLKSYQLLPASQVVIVYYFYPLLMVLLSVLFFKEKTSWKSILFILLGFTGVYLAISQGSLLKINLGLGLILTLLAALSWALFSVLIKQRKFDVEIGMFWFSLFGFLFLVLMIPFFGFSFDFRLVELAGFIYLAVFPTALAFVFWNKALSCVETSLCSNIALLTPLLSLIVIFFVLREPIHWSQILGLIIIVGSVFLNLNFGRLKK